MGSLVLRVCWRGDTSRLLKDAAIAEALPKALRHPKVVAAGGDELTWMLTEFIDGRNLASHWAALSRSDRRVAVHRSAEALRALHDWDPPATIRDRLTGVSPSSESDAETIVESCINPLPLSVTQVLIDGLEGREGVDLSLVRDLGDVLTALSRHDPFLSGDARVVVHGDLSIANVLWRDRDDISVLDFEWARLGSRDMDLPSFSDIPGLDVTEPFRWIYEGYPALFTYPHLTERLWLYEIVFALRGLLAWWPSPRQLEWLGRLVVEPPSRVVKLARARD
jgi:aminoglycoside phosphotransferase (APT) family kinase protein